MRTVSNLIEELQKCPPDAWCYAYQGEVSGIIVLRPPNDDICDFGVIHCWEGNYRKEPPTEMFKP